MRVGFFSVQRSVSAGSHRANWPLLHDRDERRYLDAELLRATSRYWSRYGHSRFVEPFEVSRDVEGEATLESGSAEHEGSMGALLGAE